LLRQVVLPISLSAMILTSCTFHGVQTGEAAKAPPETTEVSAAPEVPSFVKWTLIALIATYLIRSEFDSFLCDSC